MLLYQYGAGMTFYKYSDIYNEDLHDDNFVFDIIHIHKPSSNFILR